MTKHCYCAVLSHSIVTFCNSMDCSLPGSSVHGDSRDKNTGVGCSALLQAIFPTQGSNPGLLHCWWILYQLSHQGSQRILQWVAYPFFRGSSWPRNRTGVSYIAGGFFTSWTTKHSTYFSPYNIDSIWTLASYFISVYLSILPWK